MSTKITWNQFCEKLSYFRPELIISSNDSDEFNIAEAVVKLICPNNCGKQIVTNKPRDFWLKRTESCGCFRKQIFKDFNKSSKTFKDAREILKRKNIQLLNGGLDFELITDVKVNGKYKFKCFCGNEFGETTALFSILSNNTISCGCFRKEQMRKLGKSHTGKFTDAQRRGADNLSSVTLEMLNEELFPFGSRVKNTFKGTVSNRTIIECICRPKCGREFKAPAGAIKRGFTYSCGCLRSMLEIELYNFIFTICPDALKNTRKIIKYFDGKVRELDVFIPSKNIAIELDGLKWHSESSLLSTGKDKLSSYHKYLLCKEKGIRLITLFEDEWRGQKDKFKEYFNQVLYLNEKLKEPNLNGEIITENRLDDNNLYLKAGYKIIQEIQPSCYYTYRGNRYMKEECRDGIKYDRVWDCGKIKWSISRLVGI